ncbi:Hypothetical protein A7982_08696 [Minicystis rosea]|nr:Hypothetical protein A7982_08696 [Minicystis rosea]
MAILTCSSRFEPTRLDDKEVPRAAKSGEEGVDAPGTANSERRALHKGLPPGRKPRPPRPPTEGSRAFVERPPMRA